MGFPIGKIGSALTSPNLGLGFQAATGLTGSILGMIPQQTPKVANPYATAEPAYQAAWQMQQDATNQEAKALEGQAQIALQEAGAAARIKARDVRDFRERQALAYQGNGVLLEGSPMVVLEETRRRGQEEIDAILRRGAAQADLLRRQAMMVQSKGRASLLGEQAGFGFNKARFDAQQAAIPGGTFDPSGIANILQILSGAGAVFGNKTPAQTAPSVYLPRTLTNPGIPSAPTMFPGYTPPMVQRKSAGGTRPRFQLPYNSQKLPYGSGP